MVVTTKTAIPQTTLKGLEMLLHALPTLGSRCTCYDPATGMRCQESAVIYGFASDGAFCPGCALKQAQGDESIVDAVLLHWCLPQGGEDGEEDRAAL